MVRKTQSTHETDVVCAGFAVRADSRGISLMQMEGFRGVSHPALQDYLLNAYLLLEPLPAIPDKPLPQCDCCGTQAPEGPTPAGIRMGGWILTSSQRQAVPCPYSRNSGHLTPMGAQPARRGQSDATPWPVSRGYSG